MIDAKQIPDEVVEAAARAEYETQGHRRWEDVHPASKAARLCQARAALAAGLAAWEGAEVSVSRFHPHHKSLILPLPKEGE